MTKLNKFSPLFAELAEEHEPWEIIWRLNRWVANGGNAGLFQIDDRPHVSSGVGNFHPSSDVDKCERLLYFERTLEIAQEAYPVDLLKIFKTGDLFHGMIQAWIQQIDPDAKIEFELNISDPQVRGFIDVVLGDGIPVEIKSTNDYSFNLRKKGPDPKHVMQLALYIYYLKVPYGVLLYVNKNDTKMREFKVDAQDLGPTFASWSTVRKAIVSKDPSCLKHGCVHGDRQWSKCPAARYCYQGDSVPDWGVFSNRI